MGIFYSFSLYFLKKIKIEKKFIKKVVISDELPKKEVLLEE